MIYLCWWRTCSLAWWLYRLILCWWRGYCLTSRSWLTCFCWRTCWLNSWTCLSWWRTCWLAIRLNCLTRLCWWWSLLLTGCLTYLLCWWWSSYLAWWINSFSIARYSRLAWLNNGRTSLLIWWCLAWGWYRLTICGCCRTCRRNWLTWLCWWTRRLNSWTCLCLTRLCWRWTYYLIWWASGFIRCRRLARLNNSRRTSLLIWRACTACEGRVQWRTYILSWWLVCGWTDYLSCCGRGLALCRSVWSLNYSISRLIGRLCLWSSWWWAWIWCRWLSRWCISSSICRRCYLYLCIRNCLRARGAWYGRCAWYSRTSS